MSRIIDKAQRRLHPSNQTPTKSVLHIRFLVPKRWTNKLMNIAGTEWDPFPDMADVLEAFLGDDILLIGLEIED